MTVTVPEDTELEWFRRIGEAPLAWQLTARELICAANILFERWSRVKSDPLDLARIHTTPGPAILLYAFALENLIKALLVAQGLDATPGGVLNRTLKSHNLLRLFRESKLAVQPSDEHLLQQLQGVIAAGRYPLPVKPSADPMDPRSWSHDPCNVEHLGELLERIEDELRALLPGKILWKVPLLSLCSE